MKPTSEHTRILQQFRSILLEADPPQSLARSSRRPDGSHSRLGPPSQMAEERQRIARLFRFGDTVESALLERLFPSRVITTLEQLGLIRRSDTRLTLGEFRLVYHMSLLLFCHKISPHAKFYYGTDSLALSRVLTPATGNVLDLCAGVGAQSLTCAQTASFVTAVEIESSAERIFWINAAMNGLSHKVEFFSGDLFEPALGRQFDHICCNPPFLPVPPEIRLPGFAGGGADGLAIVGRLLEGLPEFLVPGGECQIIGSALGNCKEPNLALLAEVAGAANLRIEVSCYTYEELDERTLALFAATAVDCVADGGAKEAYRTHFTRLGVTHLYYFVLRARHRVGCTTVA